MFPNEVRVLMVCSNKSALCRQLRTFRKQKTVMDFGNQRSPNILTALSFLYAQRTGGYLGDRPAGPFFVFRI
jgi:hypothetical protein